MFIHNGESHTEELIYLVDKDDNLILKLKQGEDCGWSCSAEGETIEHAFKRLSPTQQEEINKIVHIEIEGRMFRGCAITITKFTEKK